MPRSRWMSTPVQVMAKPIGPICNLACGYCYYLPKESLYPRDENFRMSEALLEEYVRQYIDAQPGPEVHFTWQGGEPTLMGLDFFQKVVSCQQRHLPPGWRCTNALQTNGTLLDDDWGRFFRESAFLVGISLDGPAELHDRYRVDKRHRPSHAKVMRGLRILQAHGVDYNVLCTVSNVNSEHPLDVYGFLKQVGARWLQFIPVVERGGAGVSCCSVSAPAWGAFLQAIFDEWVRKDVGRIYVQIFEECLSVWLGREASLCVFAETCGRALALEHNGDLYACDHFVLPGHRLGNLRDVPLKELADSLAQQRFGLGKREALPEFCRRCDVRFMCQGGCPKDRFLRAPDGEAGLNYLCRGYYHFFKHVDPYMRRMAQLWRRRVPPALIMEVLRREKEPRAAAVGRNNPCPCGSGRKYKKCCLETHRKEAREA